MSRWMLRRHPRVGRSRWQAAAAAALLAILPIAPTRAGDAPSATIKVSSATSGSSLGGRLVEGLLHFRGADYLLTLRGVAKSANTTGAVRGLVRPRDIAGFFEPSGEGLHNAAGVTIRFDPPLVLEAGRLEIEISSRRSPKVSGGHRESGVE